MHEHPVPPVVTATDPDTGEVWRIDADFLGSSWRCIWNDGCVGIGDEERPAAGLGCCSEGAELLDEDEARRVDALGRTLDPARFQFHAEAADGVVESRAGGRFTRVVDGACVFLNRPGFAGGAGCALHIDAAEGLDDPAEAATAALEAKPSVCWQLPLKVDRSDGGPHLRAWRRDDWGAGGADMAWCCSSEPRSPSGVTAFDAAVPVTISLRPELDALLGPGLAATVVAAVDEDPGRSHGSSG